jgi:hypothetical protein
MTQLGIYESVAPLTPERHREQFLEMGADYRFSTRLNSAPLLAVEFREAAAEYPIVFASATDAVMPLVVLGVRQDENLFLSTDAGWAARYKPAFVRRYPFVFAPAGEGDRLILCIDEAYAGLNREGRGNRLFDAEGKPSAYVEKMLAFLQDYQTQFERTRALCRRLQELELLTGLEVSVALPGGGNAALKGMLGVSREKLKALPGETLAELVGNDALELVYLHLQSLRNLGKLHERLAVRQAASRQ